MESFNIVNGISQFLPNIEARSSVFKEEIHACTVVGEIVISYDSDKITALDIGNYLDRLIDDLYKEKNKTICNNRNYSFLPSFYVEGNKVSLRMKEGAFEYSGTVLDFFYKNFAAVIAYIKGKLPNDLVMDSAVVKFNVNVQNKFEFKIPELLKHNADIHYVR